MELQQEILRVSKRVCHGSVQSATKNDIIVPDTKADILKVIELSADSVITDKFISDGKLSVKGVVTAKILYIPDSETEKICSMNTAFEFSEEIKCNGAAEGMLFGASADVIRAEFNIINSRKLGIKAVLNIDYEVVDTTENEVTTDALECDLEMKKETVCVSNISDMLSHIFTVRESLELQKMQPAIEDVLKVDTQIGDTEYKCVTGRVILKGVLNIKVLYISTECEIEHTEIEIPFTEIADSDYATDNSECEVQYRVSDLIYRVAEDTDGERKIVDVEAEVMTDIKLLEKTELEMISDCFAPMRKTSLVKETVEIEEVVAKPQQLNTLKEIVDFPSGVPKVKSVYNVVMRPYISRTAAENGKFICEGKVEAYVLYLSANSDNPVYSIRKEIPFAVMTECDCGSDSLTAYTNAEIKHSGYSLNSAGEVELRCILSVDANVVKKRDIELITDIEVDEREEDARTTIYFVQKGEGVWDIAKRYAVPVSRIEKYNDIKSGDKLNAGDRLFIC